MSDTEVFSHIMDGGTSSLSHFGLDFRLLKQLEDVIFKDLSLSKINLQVHGRLMFALSLSSQSLSLESSKTTPTSNTHDSPSDNRPRAYNSQSRQSNTRNSAHVDSVEWARLNQLSFMSSPPLTPPSLTNISASSRMDSPSCLRSRFNADATMRRMLDEVASVPLSPGWQRRLRTHYADHNTCTTTRRRALIHGTALTLSHTSPISQDPPTRSDNDNAVVSTPSAVTSATTQFIHADTDLPPGREGHYTPKDRLYFDEGHAAQQSSATGTRPEDPALSPFRSRRWEMRLTSIGRVCLPIEGEDNMSRCKRSYGKKVIYFRSQPQMRVMAGKCEIKIRRKWLLEDSFNAIMALDGEDLKRWLMVSFEGEAGLDFGGVSRCVL